MNTTRNKNIIAFGLLVMSLTMACNSALSPILAEVGKFFPEASDSAIQIVLTLINLVTLPMMFLEPFLEPKMTKRDIALVGTVFMLIGGLMPQVLNSQLWMLYAASVVIGAGLSLVVVVSSSLISDYFTGLQKSRVMGFQSIFVSIGGTIIAKGSGLFTAMAGWTRGYLVFLICVPIIIIVALTVPKGEIVQKTEKTESKISKEMVYIGMSTSFALICVGAAVVGFGFAIRNPGAVTFAANMVLAAQASLAIAIVSATYNVGNFISSYLVNPMENMLGDDIQYRFIVSAVALVIIGLIACIKAPTTDAQALDSQEE